MGAAAATPLSRNTCTAHLPGALLALALVVGPHELHSAALDQGVATDDVGGVAEEVLAAAVRGDEAKPAVANPAAHHAGAARRLVLAHSLRVWPARRQTG